MKARYSTGFAAFAVAVLVFAVAGCAMKSGAASAKDAAVLNGGKGENAGTSGNAAGRGAGGSGGAGKRQAVIPVQAVTVEVGLLSAARTTAGVVAPVTQSQVAAQVSGVVLKVPRRVGDWVRSGETVMQLDDSQFRLSLESAKAALESAKINRSIGEDNSRDSNPKLALQLQSAQSALDSAKLNHDAQKALFDLGGISASALATAESQLATAQANLEGAKAALAQNDKAGEQTLAQLTLAVTVAQNQVDQAALNLKNASIRAPFTGQLSAVNLQPGMYAGLNTVAFSIVSAEKEIVFNVSPTDAALLGAGSSVTFGFQGAEYPSRVRQQPSAPVNGVVPLVADIPAGAKGLSYGSVGSVSYRVPLAQGALVPLSSLQTLEDRNYVFVVVSGRVETKDVTVIAEAGTIAAVSGVSAGDVVVDNPPPGLIKGSAVQPTMTDAAAGTSGKANGKQGGEASAAPKAGQGSADGAPRGNGKWKGKKGAGGAQAGE